MTSFKTLKESVSIKTVLEHYEIFDALVERGESLRGSCPFCDADDGFPFSVSLKKNCFNAFCCSKHGNILDFVAEREHISIKQAADKIADEFTIKKGTKRKSKPPQVKSEVVVENITEETSPEENKPLEFTLKDIDASHEQVQTLGISEQTARTFGAGYYTGRGMFKNHFVMPIYSYTGDLLAYTGIDTENPKVHLYPKQFKKEIELFGKYCLSEREQVNKPLVVCKHPVEVLILNQAGFEAVALMGDSISKEQVKLLYLYCGLSSKLTLFFAQDNNHTVSVITELLSHFHIRLARYVPQPDTPLRFKPEEMRDLLIL